MMNLLTEMVQAIAAEKPEGVSVHLNVYSSTHIEIHLMGPNVGVYATAAGAVPGTWYAFEPKECYGNVVVPQRNYRWEVDGAAFIATETILSAGITVEEASAQNEAAEALIEVA
jgi:hypothetical protein